MDTSVLTNTEKQSPESVFAPLADRPGSVWLDSSMHFSDRGRNSFVAEDPQIDVMLKNERVLVRAPNRRLQTLPGDQIWDLLSQLWNSREYFSVGYISYEATLPFLGAASRHQGSEIPSVRFLFYDSVRKFEHSCDEDALIQTDLDSHYGHTTLGEGTLGSIDRSRDWRLTTRREDYLDRVRTIKEHIREGDIYQANFTTRIDVSSTEPPFEVYRRLRRLNPAPNSAYMNFGDYQVLSSSPERMFAKQGRRLSTSPIKGTIARGDDRSQSARNRRRLLESEKDRAELLMIVDLERNDLGRIARPGSVSVDHLFKTETYSSVIHLVSDISAELAPNVSTTDVISAMLPGGSITGAPKKRAVEIINELEACPRSVYTGCIGYVHGDDADFNIAIRTMTHADSVYRIHAGGGIVADSDSEAEYREMLLKARNLLRAVGVQMESSVC
jgi:para-aminobenzoate synthetase component 1